ncbi:unnamed protein product [Linum tenue]|uniref:peptidylprolyl isomerase n=1 Tax=Linum tenue TaxID=586396 RepID=A0AAV0QIK6_9ROSI|nr:unnamed protein product [Linum tenue]
MAAKFVFSASQLQQFPTLVSASECKNLARHYHSSTKNFSLYTTQHQQFSNRQLFFSKGRLIGNAVGPISATDSGVETSITEPKDNAITVRDAKIVVESRDETSIKVRVDLGGDETEKVFGKVLRNLALTSPPIPGFRKQKGGKTTQVPRDFLIQVLGEDRVTNFVIQEIVSATLADYADKASSVVENVKVKENKVTTIQKADELMKLFKPGKEFGFNAILELEQGDAVEIETEQGEGDAVEIETE